MPDPWRRPIAANPRAWILGSGHPHADRSIGWDDPFPNFSDPDILIVDLTTLTVPVLESMDGKKLQEARQSIMDKYCSRGIVVVITQPNFSVTRDGRTRSNYCMLPIELQTKKVPKGRAIMWGDHEIFRAYRPHVEYFSFHIKSHESKLTRPPFAMLKNFELFVPHCQGILDRSQHYLGAMLTVHEWDDFEPPSWVNEVGQLVLLPPPTGPVKDAIGSILSVYRKALHTGRPGAQAAPRENAAGQAAGEGGILAGRRPPPPAGDGNPGAGAVTPAAATGGGTDVFLSYSNDAKDSLARPLAEGLEKRGVTVWWDHGGIRIGDKLPPKIRYGLGGAKHGVVVVSRGYLDSGWGQVELGVMFGKDLPTFPVLHGVSAEEAQRRLPTLSGVLMRPWDGSPESVMDEIANAIKEGRGGRADRNGPGAPVREGPPRKHVSPVGAAAARPPAESRPPAEGAPGPDPPPGRPGRDAERLLAGRNIMSVDSADFARNRLFASLYSGSLSDDEKPAVMFTACPHGLGDRCDVTTPEFMEWAKSTGHVEVDGRQARVSGIEQSVDIKTLRITYRHFGSADKNVVLYREFQASGLFEWGTSSMFFSRNDRGKVELQLCHMIGEFWTFLASARLFYEKIGLDAPFSVLLSIRNSYTLDLRNAGDEAHYVARDAERRFSPAPPAHTTDRPHIQLRYQFDTVRDMTDERIAAVAKKAARDICNAYGQAVPLCYNTDGSFSWRLYKDIATGAAGGGML